MNRRGFALLAVLWLTAALSVIAGSALAVARTGLEASRNRIVLEREAWAREACIELLLGRWAGMDAAWGTAERIHRLEPQLDSVDLGEGLWCSVRLDDPSARLNLNSADRDQLLTLLGSDSLADAILDWRDGDQVVRAHGVEGNWYRAHRRVEPGNRPFASVDELHLVHGFEHADADWLSARLTVLGQGPINLNAAKPEVIQAALRPPEEVLALINRRRAVGLTISSLDELLSLASPIARRDLSARYQELMLRVSFAPTRLIAVATGHVATSPLSASATLTVVPLPERLAVIRRETE